MAPTELFGSRAVVTESHHLHHRPHHPLQPVQPSAVPPPPTSDQLHKHFVKTAVPLVGFGFMDLTILIQTGNAIDCTLGVWLGLSTLAAAAYGSVLSNVGSVLFGNTVERAARRLGLPSAHLTHAQKQLAVVQRVTLKGSLVGIFVGCCLGLLNLLLIDTERGPRIKQQEAAAAEFEIDASNAIRPDATVVTLKGPDRDGLLAAVVNALKEQDMGLLELSAHTTSQKLCYNCDNGSVDDTFVVQTTPGRQPVADDQLAHLEEVLREATAHSNRLTARHHLARTSSLERAATTNPPQESGGGDQDDNRAKTTSDGRMADGVVT